LLTGVVFARAGGEAGCFCEGELEAEALLE
jgi:hypothetical protein